MGGGMNNPKYAVNDLVMYVGRTNPTDRGMRVEEVDANMFDIRYKVEGKWWMEGSLQTLKQWQGQV
jgi:hypothetical protein